MHACLVYALAAMPKVFESAEEKADIVHISLIDDEKPSAPPKREEPQPPIEQPKIPNEVPKEQPKSQKKPVVAQKPIAKTAPSPEPSPIVEEYKESDTFVAEPEPPVVEETIEEEEEEPVADESVTEESVFIEDEVSKPTVLGESIKLSAGGLRQSISLNDSFRFSRELFGGDTDLMNRVIEQISVMSSYKTAVAFLSSKADMNEENEAAIDFLELLKKYFNQSA